ncbi:MAG: protein-disulfide reductase DsbD [Candidatus Competibacteraceae bacterium]|nr:protein-disulfide reductase DsbD [Candidatus Competibacteraceae bacterium]
MRRCDPVWFGLAWLLALLAGPAAGGIFDRFGSAAEERILEADQAFQLTIHAPDPHTVRVDWSIAPGYYLYRDKLQLELINAQGMMLASTEIPPGELKDDPYFGAQQIFHNEAQLIARLQRSANSADEVEVQVSYQGCAEIGVCYPPLKKTVAVALPAINSPSDPRAITSENSGGTHALSPSLRGKSQSEMTPPQAEQDRLAQWLGEQRFLAIPAFFGFGLLLAFTPCVFPMVPILSSLIAGQGANLTRRRALLLALTYVLAMAVTYTIAGVLAALLGQNLQAWFQNPWVIGLFSGIFVLLALSMFGYYDLQLPAFLQGRLAEWSNHQRGGRYVGVAAMGFLSALIVGPCVAPPLIGALSFIAVTGDVLLGATALFVMSLGMGAPLLILGASTGHWLPRAGHWMERIKAIFGVLLLAVALWLLERILPAALSMVLWATLLIVTATYMGALQPLVHGAPPWRMLVKGLGTVLLVYGVLLLVGVAGGGRDPWQPLRGVSLIASAASKAPAPRFQPVKTVADIDQALREAVGRPVMLDFYADWCVSCKELERYTFSDPTVRTTLAEIVTLQADVTAHDDADRALLKHFGIVGPPAILFFGTDGRERREFRIVGFMSPSDFNQHLRALPLN